MRNSDPRKKTFLLTDACMWEKNKLEGRKVPHAVQVVDIKTGKTHWIKSGSHIKFLDGDITAELNQEDYNSQ